MEVHGRDEVGIARARSSLVDGAERAVRVWLEPGRFREGDRLPTEAQLAGMLGISRGTLRSALRRLESTGEVVRRQGSGTYVGRYASPLGSVAPRWRADRYSISATGGALTLAAMSVEMRPLGNVAASALSLEAGQRTLRIRRSLSAGQTPVAVADDIFHPDLRLPDVPAVRAQLRGGRTVHEMIEAITGTVFSRLRTQITSVLLAPDEAFGRKLELTVPTACLVLEELTSADGQPILYSRDVLAPGQMEVEIVQTCDVPPPQPIAERRTR